MHPGAAAITASMTGTKREHRRPVAFGAAFAFVATLITWCIAVRIVGSLSDNMSALDLQAATGLLAIVVLLVIMNWFFHKFTGAVGFAPIIAGAKPCSKTRAQRKFHRSVFGGA
jgi:hypothetical protein